MNKPLRIGMVCPYGWDVPGGVQMHIRELAEHFIEQGHYVSVIAPVSDEETITDSWLVNAGRPVPIPFNGYCGLAGSAMDCAGRFRCASYARTWNPIHFTTGMLGSRGRDGWNIPRLNSKDARDLFSRSADRTHDRKIECSNCCQRNGASHVKQSLWNRGSGDS